MFYWLAVIVVLVYTKYKEVFIYIIVLSEQPADSFVAPRAELKFLDTNPQLVFASGSAKKKKISSSTTA